MNYWQGFQLGLKCYSRALSFMLRNKLVWYFVFPLIFNILLLLVGFYSVASLGDSLITTLSEWTNIDEWNFWGAGFAIGLINGLICFVIRLLFFIIYAYIGGYIIIVLMSPVFALLSEQTERIITSTSQSFDFTQFIKDIIRGVLLAVRNLTIEMFFTIILFIISFIPIVGLFATLALFLVSAYFYGFSFLDYTLERRRFKIQSSIRFINQNKGLAIGNGFVFSLVLLIPYIGVMLAGFISVISVVAATLSACKAIEEDKSLVNIA